MDELKIKTPFIKLDSLLKFSGIAGDGTDARFLISEGCVTVNGETEIRRGRKIYPGYEIKVEYEGQIAELRVCS